MKPWLVLFISLFLLIGVVSANEVDLKSGLNYAGSTIVNLSAGETTFYDINSGMLVVSSTLIDGIKFVPLVNKLDNKSIIWTTGEIVDQKEAPVFTASFKYNGSTLKETIVLKEDHAISYHLSLGQNQKLIPWDNGQFKIVSTTSGNTMAGIIAEKPFGIDANGYYVDMWYTWDEKESSLVLNYNKEVFIYYKDGSKSDKIAITYPITIDPTWFVASGSGYAYTDDTYTYMMWNVTGATTFTIPNGVTEVDYIIVAGGGGGSGNGGAGGGGGGVLNGTTTNVTAGASYNVTVGAGGTLGPNSGAHGGAGRNSTFSNLSAIGGGYGGGNAASNRDGGTGGSGGGGTYIGISGNPITGQGYMGGNCSGAICTGGGGGGGAIGGIGTATWSKGGNGGIGFVSNVSGLLTYYAGGGAGGADGAGGSVGGFGGGGNGSTSAGGNGIAGVNGLGGGGGGGSNSGAAGGSGTVVLRFVTPNDIWYRVEEDHYRMKNGTDIILEMWNHTGSFSWLPPFNTSVEYIVVAGGGAGGNSISGAAGAGGGGAGGVVIGSGFNIVNTSLLSIIIGSGGFNGTSTNSPGRNGTNSTFGYIGNNISSRGGGGGAGYTGVNNGFPGGSGGGSTYNGTNGTGIFGQGQDGGIGTSSSNFGGGGGGGYSSQGGAGTTTVGGNGGNCYQTSIVPLVVMNLSGGGGGGIQVSGNSGGLGACLIGGNGGDGLSGTDAVSGTGSGGGGAGAVVGDTKIGGDGSNGVVIIKYSPSSAPIASFTINNTFGLYPLSILFTDTSTGGIPSVWNWSFGDGTWDNGTNTTPTHTYYIGGNFTTYLIASNVGGSSQAPNQYVTVYNQTISNITTNSSVIVVPPTSTVWFNGSNSINASYFNWSLDGTFYLNSTEPNSTIAFSSGGIHIINLTTSDHMFGISTNSTLLTIHNQSLANFTVNGTTLVVPPNVQVWFNGTNSKNATFYNYSVNGVWTNGTNQNFSTIFSTGGSYLVNLTTSEDGYGISTNTSIITVYNQSVTGFTSNVSSGVFPLNVGFNVTVGNDNATMWNYSFGDGTWQNGTTQNATHIYYTGGIYSITEIATNSASYNSTTINNMITVYNVTNASFTSNATTGYIPLAIQFQDLSSNATSWNWSFGDGNFSNLQNPEHLYEIVGQFSVNLTVNNTANISFINKTNYITVNGITADFIVNLTLKDSYPMPVKFTDLTDDTATSWNWSFGDGRFFNTTNSLFKSPNYTYAVAGCYTVNLTASNTYGTNTSSKINYINLTSDDDNNLVSWLHMNGTSGSTIFTDEKGLAWTSNGAIISTSVFKYGGGSGSFSPTGNRYISTVSSPALNFNTNDFTIEFWVNVTSIGGVNTHIFSKTNNARTEGWGLDCTGGTQTGWDFYMNNDTTGQTPYFTIPTGNWTHVVIERESGLIKVYINGNLTITSPNSTGNYDTTDPLWIGRQQNNYFNGFVDEFRISTGIARWKGNFTPPYNEYRGTLFTAFPDINGDSTFRYKINIDGQAYIDNVTAGGTRNRTLQIQNITNTSYVTGSMIFNPLFVYTKSVQLNLSYYPTGMTLVSSTIDNNLGVITFNISKPTGFNIGTNRASILDYTALYYNYTDGASTVQEFFGYGYLINGTTLHYYPVHNFLWTNVTYGDWNFTADFTADNLTILNNTNIFFNSTFNGSYPNRYNWSFGDLTFNNGTNTSINHIYNSVGAKNVILTEYLWQNGSVNSTKTRNAYINVYDQPFSGFTANVTTGFVNLDVGFNVTYPKDNATMWNWSFGDGTWFNSTTEQNATHIYSNGGIYTVNETASNGGFTNTTSRSAYITVYNKTTSPFSATPLSGLKPLSVTFTDTSSNGTTYYWMFGDGNTSTTKSPIYSYPNVGVYSVNHSVSNGQWTNWTNISNYISVGESAPIANFAQNISNGLYPLAVQFNSDSINALTYNWSFGDGVISSLQNPIHTYYTGGTYITNLTVNNTNSTYSTALHSVNVWNLTTNDFTASNTSGNVSLVVHFTETSTNATSWFWMFGDGNTSTTQSPTFIYNVPGIYTVNHSSSNSNNTNWTNKTNYITAYPQFVNASYSNFTANVTQGTRPLNVLFTDLSNETPTSWNWSFGDLTYSNLQNPTHIYSVSGLYTVTLNATNSNTTYHPMTKTNYINVTDITPVADFHGTPLTGDLPLLVTFTDDSTGDPGTSWNWSFGDGNFSNLQNPTHVYDVNGTWTVSMRVNNSGGSDTKTRIDYILITYPLSIVDFTANVTFGYIPFSVEFTDLSTDGITIWNWSFGDGNYSNVQNPVHTYDVVGLMTVTLNVTNPGGFNETTKVEYINSSATVYSPIASFIMNKTSAPAPAGVSFTDTSLFGPTSWNWSFGDGNFSNDQNTQYYYSHEGVFYVILNATNAFGSNSSQQTLYIVNVSTGGGGSSSSASGPMFIDANTMISFSVVSIPAMMIIIYLIFDQRKKDEDE